MPVVLAQKVGTAIKLFDIMGHRNRTIRAQGLSLAVLISCLAAMAASQLITSRVVPWREPCPTVTATATVCSTCLRWDCAFFTTVSNRCDCPAAVPTVTTSFPCGDGAAACAGVGCYTTYRWANPPEGCAQARRNVVLGEEAAAPVVTPAATASCSTVVTVSTFPESCSCTSGFCVRDKIVTLPCGCSRLDVATATETLKCPSSGSTCQQCYTGFPFTETQACGAATAPTPG
ncbi:hypothetical protein MAPG_03680 [Magnaporthiopsis poae ATCC 64411]|uniref:Uncharacterized protein n=1 Tax=Magnaporthiopsis poae (strain ATCC 64411 / 73-15) TaxID=644358 RepID=A0A0C4DUN9_MAGP6|nr:hypothetical protein MAPG_03680 [Magnaporthiopsis poae ATCC 64411]